MKDWLIISHRTHVLFSEGITLKLVDCVPHDLCPVPVFNTSTATCLLLKSDFERAKFTSHRRAQSVLKIIISCSLGGKQTFFKSRYSQAEWCGSQWFRDNEGERLRLLLHSSYYKALPVIFFYNAVRKHYIWHSNIRWEVCGLRWWEVFFPLRFVESLSNTHLLMLMHFLATIFSVFGIECVILRIRDSRHRDLTFSVLNHTVLVSHHTG